MQLRQPALADPTAFLPAADAIAKLGAAAVTMAVAFISRDATTPAILLAGEGIGLAVSGMRLPDLARLLAPLVVVATVIGVTNSLLVGNPTAGLEERGVIGLALALRLLAIAVAGVLALATTDPADLSAGLIGHLRVPARLAVGALASLRLVPLLGAEWQTIRLARRARGVDAGRNPIVGLRLWLGAVLAILVATIRRSTRLATAMDARGFDSGVPRTLARPPRLRRGDWLLLGAATALSLGAVAVSVALGTWIFVFS
jgi:energy-coupling factor transport system permease protein